jgi:hypothetical protein
VRLPAGLPDVTSQIGAWLLDAEIPDKSMEIVGMNAQLPGGIRYVSRMRIQSTADNALLGFLD